jgi:Mg-chelatase subunit ChlD
MSSLTGGQRDLEVPSDDEGTRPGNLGDLEALCGIVPKLTPSPTATIGASPSPSATGTTTSTSTPVLASPTPTVRASATNVRVRAYLPIAIREECTATPSPLAIVLVIDASSSMAGTKIDAAKAAAQGFVDAMARSPHEIAVVAFDREARLLQGLVSDVAALSRALQSVQVGAGTRIDRGLEEASRELSGPNRDPDSRGVVVLLTDGVQSEAPDRPYEIASLLRASQAAIYTIGLGADVDSQMLEELCGALRCYYPAPTEADLLGIYRDLVVAIPCPAIGFWPRIR